MAAQFKHSQVIDRPLKDVFKFFAEDHVLNHPRWDPDIELFQTSAEPLHVGSIIRRRNSRFGTPIEGTMEVVEYVPDRVLAMKILDGNTEMFGRTTFTALEGGKTRIDIYIEIPSMVDSEENRKFMMSRLERSGEIRKKLMESEILEGPLKIESTKERFG